MSGGGWSTPRLSRPPSESPQNRTESPRKADPGLRSVVGRRVGNEEAPERPLRPGAEMQEAGVPYFATTTFRDTDSSADFSTAKYTPDGTSFVNQGAVFTKPSPRASSVTGVTRRPWTS